MGLGHPSRHTGASVWLLPGNEILVTQGHLIPQARGCTRQSMRKPAMTLPEQRS